MLWYKNIFAESNKHPKVLVVDFDGTIARDKYPDIGEPLPGVKDALGSLMDAGYEIAIFSCRMRKNDGRPGSVPEQQREAMEEWLETNEIPYTCIEDGYEGKPHADYYIDNKGLHFGGKEDWESISKYILSKGK